MILQIIISLLIFLLAPFFNACMDALLFRFSTSIFRKLNPAFWNPNYISANNIKVKTIGGWKFDGWHVFQSLMICAVVAALAYMVVYAFWAWDFITLKWLRFLVLFFVFGFEWLLVKPFSYGRVTPYHK